MGKADNLNTSWAVEHTTDCSTEDTKTTATDALRKGLEDMIEACDVISEKFRDSRDDFDAQQA